MPPLRVCVIGAGASGLSALKSCLESGFECVCYESEAELGGVWRFTPYASNSSVFKSTVINTSKELTSFSDFPIPNDWPPFMHNERLLNYFHMYAQHFNLFPHIQFGVRVKHIRPLHADASANSNSTRHSSNSRWVVSYERWNAASNEWQANANAASSPCVYEECFDRVMVCVGHHCIPRSVSFPGMNEFGGSVIHSHVYKDSTPYIGKRVLVVGIGNSGVDAAVEISRVSSKCILSTRSGAYIFPRLAPGNIPLDHLSSRFVFSCVPHSINSWLLRSLVALSFGRMDAHPGLAPKHDILGAHPTVNGEFIGRIATGALITKPNIKTFTKNGVIFHKDNYKTGDDDDDDYHEIDAVVLCTGYYISFPFLDSSVQQSILPGDNDLRLYEKVFPCEPQYHSLAFIGYIQPIGSVMPISEMQSRWVCQVWNGTYPLPSKKDMEDHVTAQRSLLQHRYKASPRHTIQVDYVVYMDSIAKHMDALPNLFWLLKNAPSLILSFYFGAALPASYRLKGPHSNLPLAAKVISEQSGIPALSFSTLTKFLFRIARLLAVALAALKFMRFVIVALNHKINVKASSISPSAALSLPSLSSQHQMLVQWAQAGLVVHFLLDRFHSRK